MKDGQTIGQWLKWDFEANGVLKIQNKDFRILYQELSNGFWSKWEYDSQGNEIYHDDSTGFWVKREYYSDSQGNQIYYENSYGTIIDNRIPEVIERNGRKYQLIP